MTSREQATTPWILNTIPRPLCLRPWEELRQRYHIIEWEDYLQSQEEYAEKIEVILVMPNSTGKDIITENYLSKMTNLKLYQTWSTGTDHIDIPLLRKYKIKVGNAPGASTDACADFAMTLLLAAARILPESIAEMKRSQTNDDFDFQRVAELIGKGVSGANLGIIGMGRIGFEVARRAKGFGMKIFYDNRKERPQEDETEVQATYCSSVEALLPQVDFLVLTAPLTSSTRHVMNRETFKLMKPDAILVNIARGGLVNHEHLVEALTGGTLGGAALDVTEPEPLPSDHALLTMPNVIVTPHVGCSTREAMETMMQITVDNIHAAIDGRDLVAEVL